MARTGAPGEIRITRSVFDRLIDLEPGTNSDPQDSRFDSIRELKASVRRDLEWLLNSKRPVIDIDPGLEEVNRSIAVYGLPDFFGTQFSTTAQQKALVNQVEQAIRRFAPQLIDLKITYNPPNELERSLSFRIEARIDVEPSPEPIVFDTVLQLGSGEFGVKEI
jgi:type VI secretion system protein ImpF